MTAPFPAHTPIRRPKYLFAYLVEGSIIDFAMLLHGEIRTASTSDIYAVSLLTRQLYVLDRNQVAVLATVPSNRWITVGELLQARPDVEEVIRDLMRKRLLLSDDPGSGALEAREYALERSHWNIYAAIYHSMRTWRDVHVEGDGEPLRGDYQSDLLEQMIESEGPPPGEFHSVSASRGLLQLPPPGRDRHLYNLLTRRASSRSFSPNKSLSSEILATILFYVFGCQGILDVHPSVRLLKKTSPSGGSLHAIEVYLLIRDVDGIDPGLYHYSVQQHALEVIEPLDEVDVVRLARIFTAGQDGIADAHVLFVLTARFDREFWKYRNHVKAYGVLHMDVGHLSQTLYLICAELGLGACITGAINDANIDERLGLDGVTEGVLAVVACGIPNPGIGDVDAVFAPYSWDAPDPRMNE